MPNSYTAVTKQDGDWWIGWVEEVPGVNCQERSPDELIESLRAALWIRGFLTQRRIDLM